MREWCHAIKTTSFYYACSANQEMNEVYEKQSLSRILKGGLIAVTGI